MTSKEKLYQELGLESLENRPWFRKLCVFFKNFKSKSLDYLYNIIPQRTSPYITRNIEAVPLFDTRPSFRKNSFFPSTTIERNNLDQELRNSKTYSLFINLKLILLNLLGYPRTTFIVVKHHRYKKFVTGLRLGPNHLREHIFKHSFQYRLEPICGCGTGVKSFTHFLLQFPLFLNKRCTFMKNLNKIHPEISKFNLSNLTIAFLFGKTSFSDTINMLILDATIDFILPTKRFDKPLF